MYNSIINMCHNYGSSNGCDADCPVLIDGDCPLRYNECKDFWDEVRGLTESIESPVIPPPEDPEDPEEPDESECNSIW